MPSDNWRSRRRQDCYSTAQVCVCVWFTTGLKGDPKQADDLVCAIWTSKSWESVNQGDRWIADRLVRPGALRTPKSSGCHQYTEQQPGGPTSSWEPRTRWCTSLSEWSRSLRPSLRGCALCNQACSGPRNAPLRPAQTDSSLLAYWPTVHSKREERQRTLLGKTKSTQEVSLHAELLSDCGSKCIKQVLTWGCGSDHRRSHMGPKKGNRQRREFS